MAIKVLAFFIRYYYRYFCLVLEQVCTGDQSSYVGYDRLLGLCLCKVDDLEALCDEECRLAQYNRVQFICAETLDPFLRVTDSNGNYVVSKTDFNYILFQVAFH